MMTAEATESDQATLVLDVEAVRWGIQELVNRQVHPFFPAYLIIRRTAGQRETLEDLHPRWEDLEGFLRVPGGPPGKPNFRPFWHQSSAAGQHWMNANLAGSYAPSSIREVPRRVVELSDDAGFTLRANHWELAREHLLYGEQMPVVPLALFLYRNYGFKANGSNPGPLDLIDVFRGDFGYRAGADDGEFNHLYSDVVPERRTWFQPLNPGTAEE